MKKRKSIGKARKLDGYGAGRTRDCRLKEKQSGLGENGSKGHHQVLRAGYNFAQGNLAGTHSQKTGREMEKFWAGDGFGEFGMRSRNEDVGQM